MRFLMTSDIQKNLIGFPSRSCLTKPHAFCWSHQITWSSADLLFSAAFIWSHNRVVCLIQPGAPGIQAFCIDALTYPLFISNLTILFAMPPKKFLLSTLSKETGRNWSYFLESLSFGIWIPFANPQISAINVL